MLPRCCGNYPAASEQTDELVALANERGASHWKAYGITHQGCALAMIGNASNAAETIASGIVANQSIGATMILPLHLSLLARANADVGQFDDARRSIDEALAMVETTKERLKPRWTASLEKSC